jgi:hypothetical protein
VSNEAEHMSGGNGFGEKRENSAQLVLVKQPLIALSAKGSFTKMKMIGNYAERLTQRLTSLSLRPMTTLVSRRQCR